MATEAEFRGRVGVIDMEKRVLQMKDADDVIHPFKWTEPLDIIMRKWKAGYYLTVKYDSESLVLKNAIYWQEGKDVMPKKQGTGRQYQPRNEKLIVVQVLVKAYTDLYIASNPPDGLDFESGRDLILTAVEEDVDRLMRAGGA